MPAVALRTMLYSNRTCSTTHQVQAPLELRGVSTIAKPGCDSFQWFSKTLPSTTTFRAFCSSKMFLTDQTVPTLVGTASDRPAAPVSTSSVLVTSQYLAWLPGVRPYTRYSVAPATACQRTRTAP